MALSNIDKKHLESLILSLTRFTFVMSRFIIHS